MDDAAVFRFILEDGGSSGPSSSSAAPSRQPAPQQPETGRRDGDKPAGNHRGKATEAANDLPRRERPTAANPGEQEPTKRPQKTDGPPTSERGAATAIWKEIANSLVNLPGIGQLVRIIDGIARPLIRAADVLEKLHQPAGKPTASGDSPRAMPASEKPERRRPESSKGDRPARRQPKPATDQTPPPSQQPPKSSKGDATKATAPEVYGPPKPGPMELPKWEEVPKAERGDATAARDERPEQERPADRQIGDGGQRIRDLWRKEHERKNSLAGGKPLNGRRRLDAFRNRLKRGTKKAVNIGRGAAARIGNAFKGRAAQAGAATAAKAAGGAATGAAGGAAGGGAAGAGSATLAAAGAAILPLAAVAGAATVALTAMVAAGKAFAASLHERAEQIRAFSAELAVSDAQREVRRLRESQDAAKQLGSRLAQFEQSSSQLESAAGRIGDSIKGALLSGLGDELRAVGNIADIMTQNREKTEAVISALLETIPGIGMFFKKGSAWEGTLKKINERLETMIHKAEGENDILGIFGAEKGDPMPVAWNGKNFVAGGMMLHDVQVQGAPQPGLGL